MSGVEELLNYRRRLEKQRAQQTAEIDKRIARIDEAIETVREAETQLTVLSDVPTSDDLDLRKDMTLWEAIQVVMEAEPEKWWRGAEMMRRLISLKYKEDDKIASQVSITFRRYSQDKERRPARLERKLKGKTPVYRLKLEG